MGENGPKNQSHCAFLKNGDVTTKILIIQQQLISNFITWYQLNVKT